MSPARATPQRTIVACMPSLPWICAHQWEIADIFEHAEPEDCGEQLRQLKRDHPDEWASYQEEAVD